jgi:hypothetical protein
MFFFCIVQLTNSGTDHAPDSALKSTPSDVLSVNLVIVGSSLIGLALSPELLSFQLQIIFSEGSIFLPFKPLSCCTNMLSLMPL